MTALLHEARAYAGPWFLPKAAVLALGLWAFFKYGPAFLLMLSMLGEVAAAATVGQ